MTRRGDTSDVTHKTPAEKQQLGGQVAALHCQEGRGGRGHPAALRGCLEAGAVPGVQTPIPSSLVPCSHLSRLGKSSAVGVGAGGGPPRASFHRGWKPILSPCFHCTANTASLGPSPGAKTSQICCHASS